MTSLAPGLRREVEYNHFSLNVLSVKGKCMQSDDTQTPSPKPILWMVIPCYNEEAVLPETSGTFLSELSGLISAEIVSDKSSILFVDDGSSDSTWTIIERLSNDDAHLGVRTISWTAPRRIQASCGTPSGSATRGTS